MNESFGTLNTPRHCRLVSVRGNMLRFQGASVTCLLDLEFIALLWHGLQILANKTLTSLLLFRLSYDYTYQWQWRTNDVTTRDAHASGSTIAAVAS